MQVMSLPRKPLMQINITDLYYALSMALDAIEGELLKTTVGHGKRVAYLSFRMLQETGVPASDLADFVGVALLHDNALSEYAREERGMAVHRQSDGSASVSPLTPSEIRADNACHCIVGERNISLLPFNSDVKDIVLQHHELASGKGPLGLTPERTNFRAQLVHLGDILDRVFDLRHVDLEKAGRIQDFVRRNEGKLFGTEVVDLFFHSISPDLLLDMCSHGAEELLRQEVPACIRDYTREQVEGIAEFFARIVDYKSAFTMRHSLGVAEKAQVMARHYSWDEDKVLRFYLAGALHDVGKTMVPTGILEKPDRLTDEEFSRMKDHAAATRYVLSRISGFEDICEWASNHHEKLDGSGYSQGLMARDLSFEDRLMACADVYQALTVKRPYKDGLSHPKAIALMRNMAKDGKIDVDIVEDMGKVFDDGSQVEASELQKNGKTLWKCPVCGFIYEGPEPPATCPICGAKGYRFLPME